MNLKTLIVALGFVGVSSASLVAQNYVPDVPKLSSDIMTPEVLWSFGRLSEEAVSPDGEKMVYGVTYFNIKEDKSYRDLYITNTDGSGEAIALTNTPETEMSPCWTPDGKRIGYLSTKTGEVQMWEMNPDGSNLTQITDIKGGIIGFKYSPDMSKIMIVKAVKIDKSVNDIFPDLPKANARLETDIMYRHWSEWHDYTYNHVLVADYNTRSKITSAEDIMKGERFDSPMKPFDGMEDVNWSPDSKTITYTCKKKVGKEYAMSTNSEIYLYDIESKATRNITKGNMGYDKAAVFSPDGKYIAWCSMERDGYEADKNRLILMDLATGDKRDLTEGWDQSVSSLTWSDDSKYIYGISDIHATEEIYSFNVKKGDIKRVTNGVHDYHTVQVVGKKLIASKVSMSHPAEIYSVDIKSGEDKQITHVTDGLMNQLTMGKVEKRWITTTDNQKMLTWVVYPPNFDPSKKYPTLLYCQGGPQSTVSQFWSYRWNLQMMAANGYIVVAPNRRGLPGFGQEWCEQISKDYGGQNMKDYLVAIDTLAAEPYVDENKLGAVGASYGGFSIYYLAGHHDNRFKTFISHCGIFNFDQMYATTEESFFVNWELGGSYWDKNNAAAVKSYSQFSPHKFVQNWDTPILVIHGGKDFRIPYTQGMGAFNSAIMKGIPEEFLYFPEECHWVLKAQNGILWQRVFFQWLDKWLK